MATIFGSTKAVREELTAAKAEIDDLETQVLQLSTELDESKSKLRETGESLVASAAELETANANIAELQATVAELTESREALQAEVDKLPEMAQAEARNIVASAGHPPVPAAPNAEDNTLSIREQISAESDPLKRAQLIRKARENKLI